MTTRELQFEFEVAVGVYDTVKADKPITKVIQYWINEAYSIYINKRLKNIKNNLESKQKDIDELKNLVVRDTVLSLNGGESTTTKRVYELPIDYEYLLNDKVDTSYCSTTYTDVPNRLVGLENLPNILKYTHTKTKHDSVVSTLSTDRLSIYISDFTISEVRIDYIKQRTPVDIIGGTTIELDNNTHKEIVQLAAMMYLKKDPQSYEVELNKNIVTEQIK